MCVFVCETKQYNYVHCTYMYIEGYVFALAVCVFVYINRVTQSVFLSIQNSFSPMPHPWPAAPFAQ